MVTKWRRKCCLQPVPWKVEDKVQSASIEGSSKELLGGFKKDSSGEEETYSITSLELNIEKFSKLKVS